MPRCSLDGKAQHNAVFKQRSLHFVYSVTETQTNSFYICDKLKDRKLFVAEFAIRHKSIAV